ncbi:GWxTD domain-containing protein, partial [bacterium]|nr:GWxTD domain-containing protein [bacterium]
MSNVNARLRLLSLISLICASILTSSCITYWAYDTLDEDGKRIFDEIRYVATSNELNAFLETSPDARDEFLKEFWKKRDPTPNTPVNEFKIEHYKRLAYAEKHFRWGRKPGWKTDRGKVFIKYGKPTRIDSRPIGDINAGGGWGSKPYDEWWYDYIPYVGTDVNFLFVDVYMTGEYVLAGSMGETSNDPMKIVESSGFSAGQVEGTDTDIELAASSAEKKATERDYERQRSTRVGGGVWETKADGTTKGDETIIDIEQGVPDPFKAAVPITLEESTLDLTVGILTFGSQSRTNMVEFDFVVPNADLQFERIDDAFQAEMIISTRLYDSERTLVGGTVRRRFATEEHEKETIADDRFFTYIAGALLGTGVYEIEAVAKDTRSEMYGYVRQIFEVKIIDPYHLS